MIDYQLKPCCNDCNYLELDYEQGTIATLDTQNSSFLKTRIFCEHQEICAKYNEIDYLRVLEVE